MNFLKISCFFIVFFIVSCNPIEMGNEQHFSGILSIVVNENGIKTIENKFSTFTVQDLGLDTIPEETCGLASFVVDFDNQPEKTPPFDAKLLSWEKLGTSTFRIQGEITDAYEDTLYSASFDQNLRHFIFLIVNHQKMLKDDIYRYELLCCKDSVDVKGIMTMYLKTKHDTQGIDTVPMNRSFLIAFNIRTLWNEQTAQGNDTLKFNLKYSNRTDSIGNIIYSSYGKNPVKLPLIP